jgi:hypothetical protein
MSIFNKLFGSKSVANIPLTPSFLGLCKENYLKGIRPSNQESRVTKNYQSTVAVAKNLMADGNEKDFANYFMEGQYAVDLWTAHLILEYGNPDDALRKRCIEIITRYSTTPLDNVLAGEEAQWLERYDYIQATNSKIDKLHIMLRDVMTYYHLHKCPCSFPRFRQIAAIDCSDSGNTFYVLETEGLISEAQKYFNTEDIEPRSENVRQIWTCKTCKSTYEFGWCDFSINVDRSYLKIKDLNTVAIGEPPIVPIPVFVGAVGHSIPMGKFTHVSYEQMASYLKG